MDQAHRCHRLVDQDPQLTLPLDNPSFLRHNLLSKDMGVIQGMPSSSMVSTAARPATNMAVLAEQVVIRQLGKVIRAVNTEVTKLSEIATMATTSSEVDGAATTDIRSHSSSTSLVVVALGTEMQAYASF
jgi:hypothetical protein